MHQNCDDRKRRNLSFFLFLSLDVFFVVFFVCFSHSIPPAHILSGQCAAVSRPDLDTDFYSNTSPFDLNLAERCTTLPLPEDTVWLRLGFFCFSVSVLTSCSLYFSLYLLFLPSSLFSSYFFFPFR